MKKFAKIYVSANLNFSTIQGHALITSVDAWTVLTRVDSTLPIKPVANGIKSLNDSYPFGKKCNNALSCSKEMHTCLELSHVLLM